MIGSTHVCMHFNRLRKKSNHATQLRLRYPTAPVLSQKLERSCSSKNEELLSIVVQIGESRSTIFHCPCMQSTAIVFSNRYYFVHVHVHI